LNLAIDREILTDKVLRLGEPAAYSIVPPGVANYPKGAAMDFRALPTEERLAKAKWLMGRMGYGPDHRLRLSFETFDEPNNKRVAAVVQAMLRQIWIDLDVIAIDGAVHGRNMQQGNYDLGVASWFADFNDASNFLDLLRTGSGNNYGRYHNTAFDTALDAAQREPDARKRGLILQKAEKIALADYAWIPLRFRTTQDLVQTYVKGWIDNPREFHRTRWLWLEARPERH
jgi:oligopeptide transport system substrate-binding protein